MSFASPPQRAGPREDPSVATPMARELARARRARWLGGGAAAMVVLVVLWAFGMRPAGVELLGVAAMAMLAITVLYGLEVAFAEWRSHRLRRLAAAEQQRRRSLTEALARSDEVDVAARGLVDATTPTEAADRLLAAARRLVPSTGAAVLLGAAADLLVSLGGDGSDDAATVSSGAEELAARVLARGTSQRRPRAIAASRHAAVDSGPRVAVPLRVGAEVVGAMVLERDAGDADFTPGQQRLLERLAPHGARALARTSGSGVDGVPVTGDGSSRQQVASGDGAGEVDLAALLHELADGETGLGSRLDRRIVVLASAATVHHGDAVALRATLAALLRRVDAHAPDGSAIAVELLPDGREVEIVVAHGGGVLPERALDEAPVAGDEVVSVRRAVVRLGGTVSARERSGMAQVRVRLPVAGPSVLDLQQPQGPVDSSVWA